MGTEPRWIRESFLPKDQFLAIENGSQCKCCFQSTVQRPCNAVVSLAQRVPIILDSLRELFLTSWEANLCFISFIVNDCELSTWSMVIEVLDPIKAYYHGRDGVTVCP